MGTHAHAPSEAPPDAIQDLMRRATEAPTYDEAMPLVTEALTAKLLLVLKEGRITLKAKKVSKPEQCVSALKRSGLDTLLVEGFMSGRITYKLVDAHLTRMRDEIRARTRSADDIKFGILAFDGIAQRLSLVSGKKGAFKYPLRGNHARDSLITFARCLHR